MSVRPVQESENHATPAVGLPFCWARGANLPWMLLMAAAVALFFWKILFTKQFSILEDWEGANQAYAWHQFAVSTIQKGILPVWDPYTFSGRSFVGEMQPGLFYPLKLLLYLWPLGDSGVLSSRLFNQFYVLGHLLGACFMFFLARELGIANRFAAFVAGLCFALGGFVGTTQWPHLLDSSIWLPLILLFFLRALRSEDRARGILNACFSGLGFGMAILAGSLHIPMMNVLVVVSAAAYYAFRTPDEATVRLTRRSRLTWVASLVLVVGAVAFAAGAVQLLPSLEYAPQSVRWAGNWADVSTKKIPYAVLTEGQYLAPRSLFSFLFAVAPIGNAEFRPYLGVLPFVLLVMGLCLNWHRAWVKYLAGLAVVVYLFTLGPFSFVFGLAYILIPYLDMAREAGRFIYLTHFAMALLVGFGVQSLWSNPDSLVSFFSRFLRWLGIVVLGFVVILGIPSIYGVPEVNEWHYVCLIFWISSWGLLRSIHKGHRTRMEKFLLIALIVSDLHVFNWNQLNTAGEEKEGRGYSGKLMASRPLAEFFQSQPGLFRVHLEPNYPVYVNLGDMFGVQTTWAPGATALIDYASYMNHPKGLELLNVRYIATDKERPGTLLFRSGVWKVYENPAYSPRAWIVHQVIVEPSEEAIRRRVLDDQFEPLQTAYVSEPLQTEPGSAPESHEAVRFDHYREDRMELAASVQSAGLLVLSEVFYPGWEATRNGEPARLYKVDGLLRGIVVMPGENRIAMRYRPRSVRIGGVLTALSFLGTLLFGAVLWGRERASHSARPSV
ncbi:MAG: hypothetical protein A3H28_08225 [Acidobacteria bacterium RIFCSPLOWO2_02_FULL_61_28]|nr:MAG: hypothetical protein A3H28_08225 [Acidobacteria bacterium RIFCSPLOWO2_02_FULL_61_28]